MPVSPGAHTGPGREDGEQRAGPASGSGGGDPEEGRGRPLRRTRSRGSRGAGRPRLGAGRTTGRHRGLPQEADLRTKSSRKRSHLPRAGDGEEREDGWRAGGDPAESGRDPHPGQLGVPGRPRAARGAGALCWRQAASRGEAGRGRADGAQGQRGEGRAARSERWRRASAAQCRHLPAWTGTRRRGLPGLATLALEEEQEFGVWGPAGFLVFFFFF